MMEIFFQLRPFSGQPKSTIITKFQFYAAYDGDMAHRLIAIHLQLNTKIDKTGEGFPPSLSPST